MQESSEESDQSTEVCFGWTDGWMDGCLWMDLLM